MNSDTQPTQQNTRMRQVAMQVSAFMANRMVFFTQMFILIIVGVIIVVDLFLAFNETEGDTINDVLKSWAYERFFVLTWGWGVLAGHLFLTRASSILPPSSAILLLVGLTGVLFLIGLFSRVLGLPKVVGVPVQVVLLVVGIVAGYLLWPQKPVHV